MPVGAPIALRDLGSVTPEGGLAAYATFLFDTVLKDARPTELSAHVSVAGSTPPDLNTSENLMNIPPTPGNWCEGALCRSTADWPFDWVVEMTTVDPAARSHVFVATIRQSGVRCFDEALANVRAMARAPAMLRLLQGVLNVIDMSDPDHPAFTDSAADCLDELLPHQEALRALLAEFGLGTKAPALPLSRS